MAWFIYHKGESAGSATVTNAVQRETIKQIDNAKKSKVRTDEKVRNTPYHDLVDGSWWPAGRESRRHDL
jgi:hypothetical protein